jgi:hypothetical protein
MAQFGFVDRLTFDQQGIGDVQIAHGVSTRATHKAKSRLLGFHA